MQTRAGLLGDASMRAQSLDDAYYYGGQQAWDPVAIVADKEAGIQPGDKIYFLGNHWNGYAKLIPPNSKLSTIRPAFKFENRMLKVDFGPQINVP